MDQTDKQTIAKLEREVADLSMQVKALTTRFNKNNFSNLFIFETPVQFNKRNVYPGDTTAAGAYKGRIAVMIDNVVQYLHYFDA